MPSQTPIEIAVAYGDGIGPEIMRATLSCLEALGAPLAIREIEVGEKVYLQGEKSGISESSWEILRSTKAFLKAPVTTPQGGGFRSLNVTIRSALGLYANVRPCVAYPPFVETLHPQMDVVIIRENEEDLYTGIEYTPVNDTAIALKIITETGCQRIIRYAFEYARLHGRKKVTCFTKDNIMKQTDGMFHKIFDRMKEEYPDIESEHWIVDIGAAKLADTPEQFDVIVLPNLYGDILSDVAAQIAGSVGLAGSANIGTSGAMFEAIHGSAPRRAGQNIANPSGLILASVMMLSHLQLHEEAEKLHNAWLKTIEDGIHTYDIYQEGVSKKKVGTKEFASHVIERLGSRPQKLKAVSYEQRGLSHKEFSSKALKDSSSEDKKVVTASDFFFVPKSLHYTDIESSIQHLKDEASRLGLELIKVSSRGNTIWPASFYLPVNCELLRATFTLSKERERDENELMKLSALLHSNLINKDKVTIRGFFLTS